MGQFPLQMWSNSAVAPVSEIETSKDKLEMCNQLRAKEELV